jgi:hypothetical protein
MSTHFTRSVRILIVLAVYALLVAACSTTSSAPFYKQVSDARLKAGDTLPAPTGDVILTVTGKIGTKNTADGIAMDRDMIESVGQVDYTVTDPFETKDYVYRGPMMSALLDLWQVSSDATTLEVVALDDYTVNVPIDDLRKYPVLFAVQQDGQYMPVSTRGPAMLVYPYNNFDFNHVVYNDYWAWQIKSIVVN